MQGIQRSFAACDRTERNNWRGQRRAGAAEEPTSELGRLPVLTHENFEDGHRPWLIGLQPFFGEHVTNVEIECHCVEPARGDLYQSNGRDGEQQRRLTMADGPSTSAR